MVQTSRAGWGGDPANLKASLDALRAGARRRPWRSLCNPGGVPPNKAEEARAALGADAISIYAGPIPQQDDTYAQLDGMTRDYWAKEVAATTGGVVPTVMIGWDTRPRKEHPPWWDNRPLPAKVDMKQFVSAPTPAEFAAECQYRRPVSR